jgi:hypothetical protein
MSESVTDRLSRFTPDGSGLDRAALLFAAGRASARPNRPWKVLVGALAASQLLTLTLLWPRSVPPAGLSPPSPFVPELADRSAPEPPDASGLLALGQMVYQSEGIWPSATVSGPLVAADRPLHALAALDPLPLE